MYDPYSPQHFHVLAKETALRVLAPDIVYTIFHFVIERSDRATTIATFAEEQGQPEEDRLFAKTR